MHSALAFDLLDNAYVSILKYLMRPLPKRYMYCRHCTTDSKTRSGFQTYNLHNNITLPPNTSVDINAITNPVSGYTVEDERDETRYFMINGPDYSASRNTLPERNYTTTTLVAAMCALMDAHYPFDPPVMTFPKILEPHANLVNNTVSHIEWNIQVRTID